jgi:hypothetical protein
VDAITGAVMAQRTTNMNEVDLDSFILIIMEDKKMKRRVRRSQRGKLTARN